MEWQHIYASPADKYKQNMQMYVGTLREYFRGRLWCDSFLFCIWSWYCKGCDFMTYLKNIGAFHLPSSRYRTLADVSSRI